MDIKSLYNIHLFTELVEYREVITDDLTETYKKVLPFNIICLKILGAYRNKTYLCNKLGIITNIHFIP